MKIYFLTLFFILGATTAYAQTDYTPLAPLEGSGLTQAGKINIDTFIPNLVKLIIGIAGGLAVIMIIVGGIKYLSTDAWSGKSEARGTIQNALIGLLLAMSAYTILNTVNPKLVDININNINLKKLEVEGELNPNTGQITSKTAEELGCLDDCEPIDAGEITVRPGSCSNNPCYLYEDLLDKLDDEEIREMKYTEYEDDGETCKEDDDGECIEHRVYWQIIRAFPQSSTTDACYKANPDATSRAGKCIDVSLPNPSTLNIKSFVAHLKNKFGADFRYYQACPQSRAAELKREMPTTEFSLLIQCNENRAVQVEHAHIETSS